MTLLNCILFYFLCVSIASIMNFQRIIWVYWQTDFQEAPLVTRNSYEKLVLAAKQANWTVNIVNGQNARQFIPDYERFEDVVRRGYRNTVQEKSDILRITLIQANGGVWIDFACALFEDLSWLTNQKLFQHLIINRIGTNMQDPDMLMLGEGYHQSPLSYFNEDGVLVSDQYFGMAIHFIAAKKKSPIMTAWKQKMYNVTTLSYNEFLPQATTKRLYFHNIDRNTMYYSGNLALQSVLQEKQMEFDDNLTLSSQRVNVYEHFKIWMVHGEVGPILLTRKHLMNVRDLFMDTRQEIEKRAGKIWFYLKMAKFLREDIEQKQNATQQYFTKNKITVQQILQRGPTISECQLFFIVQGSILHNYYKGSKYESQIKTPFISVDQRQQLKSHCWHFAPSVYLSFHSYRSEGQMTRPERELMHGKVNGLVDSVGFLWTTNTLVIWAWFEWFRTLIYMVVGYALCKYFAFRFDTQKISGMDTQNELTMNESASQRSNPGCLQSKFRFRFGRPQIKEIIFIIILATIVSATLQFYQEIQDMGKYPQYQCTFLFILIVFLSRGLLKKLVNSTIPPTFFNMQNIMKDSRYAIYLALAFCVFIHLDIVYSYAYYHTVVVVGGGLLLYGLLEESDERGIRHWGFDVVRKVLKFARWIVIGVFGLFYFVPNLRYLRQENRYIKEHLSQIYLSIFWVIFVLTIVAILFTLINHLKKLKNHKTTQHTQISTISKNNIYQLIYSTISVFLITFQSHLAYIKIISSPSSYSVMGDFQVILIVYTLCGISLRQRLPQQQSFTPLLKYMLVLSNCFQIFYMVFGLGLLWVMEQIPLRWIVIQMLPLYVVVVIVGWEWMNKETKSLVQDGSGQMFHEVQLSPTTYKD